MPANRFDTSKEHEYVSSYIPLPFEQIAALGEKTQKKYDSAIDDTYKLKDLMTKVPAIHDPNLGLSNLKKKQDLDAQFAPKIDELTNKIISGDANAYRELEQVKRDFVNNPIRQELENSYADYKTYKEDIIKKGGKYDRLLDDYYGQQLVDESGELKPFRYSGMEDSLDAPKRFKEIMGDIAEDAKSWDIESLGTDGIKIGNKGKRAGVSETKVNNVVNNKVNLALNTDEGKQFVKRLRRMKPDITNEELINETRKALFSSAYEQIGSNIESGNSIGLTDMWTRQQDKKDLEAPKNPWNMYVPNADPDPSNSISKALYNANPNSAFEVESNGEIKDIKSDELGTKNTLVYKDNQGKVWNPSNLPAGWSYKKDSRGGDYFESTGGTKVYTATLQSDVQKINTTDIYAKQVNEVLQWAAATNQLDKNSPGSENYANLLPKYKAAIKNGALNSHYVPQFDAETAANFKETFAPKLVTTANGTTVKDPGLVANWVIEGVSSNEEKNNILNNFNPVGLDMVKGGDNILINSVDGKEYSVNMNNPSLKATFGELSKFIKDNNTAKINPTKTDSKQTLKSVSNYLTNLANDAIALSNTQGLNPVDAQNEIMTVTSSYETKANDLIKRGYIPTTSYQDPTTGTFAVSYINHSTPGGQEVKVLKHHSGVDVGFEELSEAAFNREVQQKAFGNFASNLNTKGSKTTGSFIENQKQTK